MGNVVVVGGGISSLLAATLLARDGHQVTIAEREPQVGGLLNSIQTEAGDWFDYGTHFIAGTNVAEIDDIILPEAARQKWQCFENERGGNVFAGHYSQGCLFVDTRAIDPEAYRRGVADYLAVVPGATLDATNVEKQLVARFGRGFTDAVYRPALRKLFGVNELDELTPDAHLRFGMKRLKAFTAEQTRELKRDPHHDDRLCFHEFSEGPAARHQYYPASGGAGEWVQVLADQARNAGVAIRCSSTIAEIQRMNRDVVGVTMSDGSELECDLLVWSVPLFSLLRMFDVRAGEGPPTLRQTNLFHLVFDRAPITSDHFVFCYDPAYLTFRATLYSNLQPSEALRTGRHRVTVETLTSGETPLDEMAVAVQRELPAMGLLPSDASLLDITSIEVREGFPVLDHRFERSKQAQMQAAESIADNVVYIGRSCTDAWFMHEVFTDVWHKLSPAANVPWSNTARLEAPSGAST